MVCDRRITTRLKMKIFKTVIRPGLMYGAETALQRKETIRLMRTEIRMLRWIFGISLLERCTNEEVRKS